jgi:hypothetical protein
MKPESYSCTTLDNLNDTLVKLDYTVLEVIEILEEYEAEVIERFSIGDIVQINIMELGKVELKLIKKC